MAMICQGRAVLPQPQQGFADEAEVKRVVGLELHLDEARGRVRQVGRRLHDAIQAAAVLNLNPALPTIPSFRHGCRNLGHGR